MKTLGCLLTLTLLAGCIGHSQPLIAHNVSRELTKTSRSSDTVAGGDDAYYAQYSGTTIRATPSATVTLGQGYSRLSGAPRGFALGRGVAVGQERPESSVTYELTYVDSFESLAKAMKMEASASFSGLTGGASAKAEFLRESKFSANKAYALVRISVLTGTQALESFSLASEAREALVSRGESVFFTTYGDSFVQKVGRGAELNALLQFSASSTEDKQQLKTEISGNVGAFKASLKTDSKIESLLRKRDVRVQYMQVGGQTGRTPHPAPLAPADDNTETRDAGTGALIGLAKRNVATTGGVLVMTPDEFLGRIRDFPVEALSIEGRKNSKDVWIEVVDYNVASNFPARQPLDPQLLSWRTLEDMGRIKLALDEEKNTIAGVLEQPASYTFDAGQLLARHAYLDYATRQFDRLAVDVATFPLLGSIGRGKIGLPAMANFTNVRTDANGKVPTDLQLNLDCTVPKSGDVDLFMRCVFGVPDRTKDWRFTPIMARRTRLAGTVRVPFSSNLYLPGRTFKVEIPLVDEAGTQLTGPAKRFYVALGNSINSFLVVAPDGTSFTAPTIETSLANTKATVEVGLNFHRHGPLIGDPARVPDAYFLHWVACADECTQEEVQFAK